MKTRHFIKAILASLVFVLSNGSGLFAQIAEYRIENPELLAERPIRIKTEWDFFWKKNIHYQDTDIKPDLRVTAPSEWNKYKLDYDDASIVTTGKGSGTYRLKLTNLKPFTNYAFPVYEFAYTAFTISVNGREIFRSGRPSVKWEKTNPEQFFDKAVFTSDEKGCAVICVFVSNEFYRKGGLRGDFFLSEEPAYIQNYMTELCLYGIFVGLLLMIALYCLLTALMKKDRTNLFLGVLVIGIISRIVGDIFPLLKELFPLLPFTVMIRIEYFSLFCIPAMHTFYFDSLNKKIFGRHGAKILAAPAMVLFILDCVLPAYYVNRIVPVLQIYMFALAIIDTLLCIIRFIKDRDFISGTAILSFVFLGIGAISVVLSIQRLAVWNSGRILTIALVIYALCQIALLAYIQNRNYMKVIELNDHLVITNKAYFRFVPKEFLGLLSKKNITEVSLGEYKIAKMAILSADIRNFTSTSEKLSPKQVFDMLNSYLGKIAPLIRKYDGLIEKYLGDGIIAIFPNSAVSAFNCALEMQEQMIALRSEFEKAGMPLIKIGIGIHYGDIVIGTGGDNKRMTEISLSEDIDLAAKTEAATKLYNRKILVTLPALRQASNEVRHQGQKFSFYGEKIDLSPDLSTDHTQLLSTLAAKSPQLYALYNDRVEKSL